MKKKMYITHFLENLTGYNLVRTKGAVINSYTTVLEAVQYSTEHLS